MAVRIVTAGSVGSIFPSSFDSLLDRLPSGGAGESIDDVVRSATQAAERAARSVARTGGREAGAAFSQSVAENLPREIARAILLGIPPWLWVIGGVGVGFLVWRIMR